MDHKSSRPFRDLRLIFLSLLVAPLALASPPSAAAQPSQQAGQVDPNFGASLGLAGSVQTICLQPDGKVLVVGYFPRGLARLNSNGTVDAGFDAGLDGAGPQIDAIAVQPDGKVLVGGSFDYVGSVERGGIARLNSDGSLDQSFDPGTGLAAAPDSEFDVGTAYSLAVQPDGRVIIGGSFISVEGSGHACLARLNADGSLDSTFANVSGLADTLGSAVLSVALQSDGKVIVGGGFSDVDGASRSGIARLNADGTLGSSFNPALPNPSVEVVALQPDGKILVLETSVGNSSLVRLAADGSLDPTFAPAVASYSVVTAQPDGRILIAGVFTTPAGTAVTGAARLNSDGSFDSTFTPVSVQNAGGNPVVSSLALQPDGRVLIGGFFTSVDQVTSNGVARIEADGTLDPTFVADTQVGPNLPVTAVCVQPDGRLLIAGEFTTISGVSRPGVARFATDGTLDLTFDPGSGPAGPTACLVLQADGRVIIAGEFASFAGVTRNGIARLDSDGSVDQGFQVDFGHEEVAVSAVAVQPDGRLLIGGQFKSVGGAVRNAIARVNADGSLDPTFTPSGITPLEDFGVVESLALQSDGKVLIGGRFAVGNSATKGVARLNADGSVDPGFSAHVGDGSETISSLLVQSDGEILVSGNFFKTDGLMNFGFARLQADGSLDPGFSSDVSSLGETAIALQPDGKVLVATDTELLRLDPDGTLDPSFAAVSLDGQTAAIAVSGDGNIAIVGAFTVLDGAVRNYVAVLDTAGAIDPAFDAGEGIPAVNALVLQPDDSGLFVGGDFTTLQGRPINSLARLFASDGTLDTTFAPTFAAGETVYALALQQDSGQSDDGDVLVSSIPPVSSTDTLDRIPAVPRLGHRGPQTRAAVRNPIHRCNKLDGSFDPAFNANAGTDGTTLALGGLPGGLTLLGGSFANVNGSPQANLARLTLAGDLDPAFTATANGAVRSVDVTRAGANALYLAGDFTTIDGVTRNGVARIHDDGSIDNTFDAGVGPNGSVYEVLYDHGAVYIAGNFTAVDGLPRGGHALLNGDGTINTGYAPGPTLSAYPHSPAPGAHHSLAGHSTNETTASTAAAATTPALVTSLDVQPDGKVIIGGLFSQTGGVARSNVARFNVDGSVDDTFEPGAGPSAQVNKLKLQPDGRTLIGGNFTSVDGLERRGAARLLGDPATVTVAAKRSAIDVPAVGKAKFLLTRAGGDLTSALTVTYVLRGTAQEGIDYLAAAGTVSFAANQTTTQVKVQLIKTGTAAALESTLKFKLKTGAGYALDASTDKASVTIIRSP